MIETRVQRVGVTRPFVLAVGTVEPRKGLDMLAKAFTRARVEIPNLSLAIVGPDGWLSVPGLDAPGIRRLGTVDEHTLDALYRRALLCAVPSRYEGFGLPALEAMARGCPVIASNATSLPEVVGAAGLLIPVGAVDAWAEPSSSLAATPNGVANSGTLGQRTSRRLHLARFRLRPRRGLRRRGRRPVDSRRAAPARRLGRARAPRRCRRLHAGDRSRTLPSRHRRTPSGDPSR